MAFWNKLKEEDTPNNSEMKQENTDEAQTSESIEKDEEINTVAEPQTEQSNDEIGEDVKPETDSIPQLTVEPVAAETQPQTVEPKKSKRELKREEKERIKAEKEAAKLKKKHISGFSVFLIVLFINAIWVCAVIFYFFPMYNDDIWQRENQIEEYEDRIQSLQAVYDNMSEEYKIKIDELEDRLDKQEEMYNEAIKLIEKYEQKLANEESGTEAQADSEGGASVQDENSVNQGSGE